MSRPIVKKDQTGDALYAARDYAAGEIVLEFRPVDWLDERGKHTLEHPSGRHLYDPVLGMAAHSCDPNCHISYPHEALVASRSIRAGEPITFDYQITESVITHPFDCQCGSPRCRGRIE